MIKSPNYFDIKEFHEWSDTCDQEILIEILSQLKTNDIKNYQSVYKDTLDNLYLGNYTEIELYLSVKKAVNKLLVATIKRNKEYEKKYGFKIG